MMEKFFLCDIKNKLNDLRVFWLNPNAECLKSYVLNREFPIEKRQQFGAGRKQFHFLAEKGMKRGKKKS